MKTIFVAAKTGPSAEDLKVAKALMTSVLGRLGYDTQVDEHMRETPSRFINMLEEYFVEESWEFNYFEQSEGTTPGGVGDPGIVAVRDIPFQALCAHHLAPFHGVAHIAYIPNRRLAGLSKFARAVEHFAKGPNVQEQIGADTADFLYAALQPLGVMVVLDAEHTCYTLRGVRAHGSRTTTSAVRGVFFDDARARQEAMDILTNSGRSR